MSEQDHLQQLIINYTRRLRKLKEQQALIGVKTDPAILIEIEDIEAELDRLQTQLAGHQAEAQTEAGQDLVSSGRVSSTLKNIETKLGELQVGLAALEEKLVHEMEPKINPETASLSNKVQIELPPTGLEDFGPAQIGLLQRLYPNEQRVMVEREFSGGFGGTRVFLVRPINQRGHQLARQIVKIGPPLPLKKEQQNYDDHVGKAHPFVVAQVTRYVEWQGLGGIIYNFVGDGRLGPPRTLEEVFLDEQVSAEAINRTLEDLLDKALGEGWYHQTEPHVCFFDDEYGPHLVEHLRVRVRSHSQDGMWRAEQTSEFVEGYRPLKAEAIPAEHAAIQPEALVQIEGLVITKIKPKLLKLQRPRRPGIVVKVEMPEEMTFTPGQAVTVRGEVRYNRPLRLAQIMTSAFANVPEAPVDPEAETLTWAGKTYPNPLHLYPTILSRTLTGQKSLVHGDLHLRNILVDETGHGWLIDFALVKERHNLYDFIKLEVYIRQMVLSQADFSFTDYLQFEEALFDEAVAVPEVPALRKGYQVIRKVREVAARYARNFEAEYLPGLFLYSLAVVKYVDNHGAKATRLAFGTAGVVGKGFTTDNRDRNQKHIFSKPEDQDGLNQMTKSMNYQQIDSKHPSTLIHNPSKARTFSDFYSPLEIGLENLLGQMEQDSENYLEVLTWQQRLSENIKRSRRFGNTADRQSERAEVIEQLNQIALRVLGVSFNKLCEK